MPGWGEPIILDASGFQTRSGGGVWGYPCVTQTEM